MACLPDDVALTVVPFGGAGYDATKILRETVLRVPLGLCLSEKDVEGEAAQIHIVACDASGVVLGVVLLKPISGNTVKLRQMAVSAEVQGAGLGRKLVAFAEETAKERGFREIETHARLTALGFYGKLGYMAHGEPFTEVTVQTIRMTKALLSAS